MPRPLYEALDRRGIPYIRAAETIQELPTPEARMAALAEATPIMAIGTGLKQIHAVKFGTPVFCALEGMTRAKAKHHLDAKLLLTLGCDISLDFCPSYNF